MAFFFVSFLLYLAVLCWVNWFGGSGRHVRPRPGRRRHVFLSHRGPDGRHKFADHLDAALRRKRINVFRDDRDLRRGENVTEAISRVIDDSMLSLVVLSRGYASSEYCLDELVQIMRCREMKAHRPFPVFYGVCPDDDVAHPSSSGCYKADFDRHKRTYSYERVDGWIHALRSISRISGWVITDKSSEAEIVEEIAEEMLWNVNNMGAANGTRGIRWENDVAAVYDRKEKMEGSTTSSNREAPQPAAGEDGVDGEIPSGVSRDWLPAIAFALLYVNSAVIVNFSGLIMVIKKKVRKSI